LAPPRASSASSRAVRSRLRTGTRSACVMAAQPWRLWRAQRAQRLYWVVPLNLPSQMGAVTTRVSYVLPALRLSSGCKGQGIRTVAEVLGAAEAAESLGQDITFGVALAVRASASCAGRGGRRRVVDGVAKRRHGGWWEVW
jgi:hypothetical protein